MATITREITVDVARENLFAAILAKQGDLNSRFLKIRLTNLDVPIDVPQTSTAIINARRADGEAKAFMAEINEDGTITAPLTQWMLGLDDTVNCSISVISENNEEDIKLTSLTFRLDVQYAEYEGSDITEDPNYDILVTLINEANEAATAASGAASEAGEAATAANNAAEAANSAATRANDAADFFGSPLVAATAAAMTATDHVYVYIGSETGYTYGNWYYYNGSAWVSGGIYNAAAVATDTTLTQAGKPADAKATGDAINDTQEMIAPRETTSTASQNYAVGDFLVYNEQLYKVTAAIATGETISSSNTEETDVVSELATGSGGVDEGALTSVEPWYTGTNLATKFADEITSYGGDPWAWIKARITAGNFAGIHVNDYIPFTTTNDKTLNACVAGINTYKGYGDTAIGNHIDFICRELWSTRKPINPAGYNNGLIPVETITGDGTTTSFVLTKQTNNVSTVKAGSTSLTGWTYDPSTFTLTFAEAPAAGSITVTGTGTDFPWLASDLYHWLNSLSGQVPNGTGLNPAVKHVDYTQGGVYYYLPENLKNVIATKRAYLPKRYSATGMLNDDNNAAWTNIGKLWLPSEFEVYGAAISGGKTWAIYGNCVQYPIFAHNMNRVKERNGSRDNWWVITTFSGSNNGWCRIASSGYANSFTASDTSTAAPVCFRIK